MLQRTQAINIVTTHFKHAWEIARDLPLGKYDAIAAVSGDGLIHEILNGFAEHKEAMKAFQTPLVPIPAGSGNALSLNLLGMEVRFQRSIDVWCNTELVRRRDSTFLLLL